MISDTDLLDANLWLALVADKHTHHARAKAWFETRGDRRCAFCRVTQFALLRHLTNRAIMGPNVRTPVEAWALYASMTSKRDVVFAIEPPGLEQRWREWAGRAGSSGSWWTDTYLTAFAQLSRLRLVTFDQGFPESPDLELIVLAI